MWGYPECVAPVVCSVNFIRITKRMELREDGRSKAGVPSKHLAE